MSKGKYLVGVDAGTTGCCALIIDLEGNELASAYAENPLRNIKAGWVELDPMAIVDNAHRTTREAIAKAGIDPKDIASVSFTMMRPSVILRDENGKILRDIIMWQDLRSAEMLTWMEERLNEAGMTTDDLYDITGMPMSTVWSLPRLLWTKVHEPEIWEKTKLVHNTMALLLNAYGVDGFIDDTDDLNWWQINDADKFDYDPKLAEIFDLDEKMFSKHVPSGTVVGSVSATAAEKSGLAEGTPLVMGSGDHQCAALGMGNVREGMASLVLGTAGVIVAQSDKPVRDPNRKAHVVGSALHKWEIEGHSSAAASSFKWVRSTFGQLEQAAAQASGLDCYELLTMQAGQAQPGSQGLLYLPWLAGATCPRYNADARGAFIGMTFGHAKADIIRASLEGVCYEMRAMIDTIKSAGLPEFEFIRVSGGAAKSELWNQIQADIYGRPVEAVACSEATAFGAAMIGAVGIGIFDDLEEAADNLVHVTGRWDPIPENVEVYNELYAAFNAAYDALAPEVFPAIAEAQGFSHAKKAEKKVA